MNSTFLRNCAIAVVLLAAQAAWAQNDKFQPDVIPDSAVGSLALIKAKHKLTKDGNKAVQSLAKLVAEHPNYYAAHYNRGLLLAELGRYGEAVDALETAKRIRETGGIKDATVYNSLGWVQLLKGDAKAAEASFVKAREHEGVLSRSSKGKLYNNLGWLYFTTGRFGEARSALQVAVEQHGNETAADNMKLLDRVETTMKRPSDAAAPR